MVRLFGDQVCKSVSADGKCTLTKVAEQWMNEINSVVANGHCEGMAVLSSLFYSGLENPSDYGSSSVNKLQLKNNIPLQREIAYWFTTQWFMDDHLIEKDPTSQVKYLINHFKSDSTPIPLGIYQRNLKGGHAITAYAVVDHGNGIYYIMVYDNNYPNEERYARSNRVSGLSAVISVRNSLPGIPGSLHNRRSRPNLPNLPNLRTAVITPSGTFSRPGSDLPTAQVLRSVRLRHLCLISRPSLRTAATPSGIC